YRSDIFYHLTNINNECELATRVRPPLEDRRNSAFDQFLVDLRELTGDKNGSVADRVEDVGQGRDHPVWSLVKNHHAVEAVKPRQPRLAGLRPNRWEAEKREHVAGKTGSSQRGDGRIGARNRFDLDSCL